MEPPPVSPSPPAAEDPTLVGRLVRGAALLLFASLFWPALGLTAGFLGLDRLSETAWLLSPRLVVDDERLDEAVNAIRYRRRLETQGKVLEVGALKLYGPARLDLAPLERAMEAAVASCSRLLGRVPFHPVVFLQSLGSSEGSFQDFFRLTIDPSRGDPERVIAHELVHFHLLLALLPGLPVDCPRWFNEGLAEEVSAALAADADLERRFALLLPGEIDRLDRISYGFSRPGTWVEIQSREAVRLLRERAGDEGILRLVHGLRLARSFRTVFRLTFGHPPERFEAEHLADLAARGDPRRLPPRELVDRLEWMVTRHPGARSLEMVRTLAGTIGPATVTRLLSRGGLAQADRCRAEGRFREAMGWLAPLARAGDPEARALLERVRQQAATEPGEGDTPLPRPLRSEVQGWILALVISIGLLALYRRLRTAVTSRLYAWWLAETGWGLAFRWTVLILVGFGGAWFLRILIVGFLPYAGWGRLDDLGRILLAEVLVVLAWLGLAWQFARFDRSSVRPVLQRSPPSRPGAPEDRETRTGSGTGETVKATRSGEEVRRLEAGRSASAPNPTIFFLLGTTFTGWLPAFVAAQGGGWTASGLPWTEVAIVLAVNASASLAFFGLFGRAAARWQARGTPSGMHPAAGWWGAGLAYALFRGGLGGDPGGWAFALLFGRIQAERTATAGKVLPAVGWDLLFLTPHLVLAGTWFPAQDPLGGMLVGEPVSPIAWLIPLAAAGWVIRWGAGPSGSRNA